jgi:formylglycine-generating enzyme required for sulfatase activity
LTPCYYNEAGLMTVYKTGTETPYPKWNANGYRLPTEAEWEKAARGGASGKRFPWRDSDTIQHSRANYYSSSLYAYDTSLTRGYHPTFDTGDFPYTSPVGYFGANGYGLCDMAGNVWECCWDWYQSDWYSQAGATQSDTRGPTGPLSNRVWRGGDWRNVASYTRCATRVSSNPGSAYGNHGFRCVRGL